LSCTDENNIINDEPLSVPIADHHTHLRGPEATQQFMDIKIKFGLEIYSRDSVACTAKMLINDLDNAGISKASVLSVAYMFGMPEFDIENEYEMVKEENNWVSSQIDLYPDRLFGFVGINPLKDYAVDEIKRAKEETSLIGVKLHLTNSNLDFTNTEHVNKLRKVFETANNLDMPIIIHMRGRGPDYGAEQARIFLDEVLPAANDVIVQIAHVAGWGGYDPGTDAALNEFVKDHDSGKLGENIIFDFCFVVPACGKLWESGENNFEEISSEEWQKIAETRLMEKIHKIGLDRFFFGTDWMERTQTEYLNNIKCQKLMNPNEWNILMSNLAPYMKD